ncbi:MAG: cation transporter [Thermincola sp.]|jgi:copper chaperone|nr:cation transporter [Thermincola sp.]MDT3703535.1 cation transporter [Thermincola sp.]
MANVVLSVEGMSCNHCKMAVEKALKTLDGVQDAAVDLAAKTVSVDYNSSVVNGDSLKKTIIDAGYEVV